MMTDLELQALQEKVDDLVARHPHRSFIVALRDSMRGAENDPDNRRVAEAAKRVRAHLNEIEQALSAEDVKEIRMLAELAKHPTYIKMARRAWLQGGGVYMVPEVLEELFGQEAN